LKKDDSKKSVGRVRKGARAAIAGEESIEVQLLNKLIDEAYVVVVRQAGLEGEKLRIIGLPRKRGETAGAFGGAGRGWCRSQREDS